ncbi:transcriptional regulator [Nocardioides immobilis]|uniref:Transcriptional regulator n=1 Tax=Nocardioides immobilis TaxID=2049295 RepID=A0A417XV43_9ACTN|nr:transcriptional regulator [Nocardioides immobilis]
MSGVTVQLAGRLAARGDVALGDRCSVDRTMQVVGNRTAMLLIREAFYGATRFEQLAKRVGVTEAVASQRLKELVAAGILAKQPYREPGQRTRFEYVLTPAGHELMPVLLGLLQWGARHLPHPGGRVTVTHDECGAEVQAALRCADGHDVPEEDVVVRGDVTR